MTRSVRAIFVICSTAILAIGCSSTPSAKPLTAESFYSSQTPSADPAMHPQDRPGVIDYEGRGEPQTMEEVYRPLVLALPTTTPVDSPSTAPVATAPVSQSPLEEGVFQVVGFVVAEVNGVPIFADEVIKQLRSLLVAEAKKLDRDEFRDMARGQLQRQVDVLIANELVFAAADRELPDADRKIAQMMTQQWRNQEITKVGGSEQMTRRRYADQGVDFDEEVRRRYRANLVQVFTHRKIIPLVRVSADDIREYYTRNINEFTEFGEASFRLIKIDPKLHDGRDAAERRAREIRTRALSEDFKTLASSDANDNPNGRAVGGLVENMKQGSYVLENVESTVWKSKVGDVTDVIVDGGAFYIAKVESLTPGSVKPFSDVAVQTGIRRRLEAVQFQRLNDEYRRKLESAKVVRGDREQLSIALDMIMQNYDSWASAQ